jgi:hypothetical protein
VGEKNSAGVSFLCDKAPTTVVKLTDTKNGLPVEDVRKHKWQRYKNQYAKIML